MIEDHYKTLEEISNQCDIPMNTIHLTFCDKITDYIYRDTRLGKNMKSLLNVPEQGNRAISVMETYAVRKLGYIPLPDYNKPVCGEEDD